MAIPIVDRILNGFEKQWEDHGNFVNFDAPVRLHEAFVEESKLVGGLLVSGKNTADICRVVGRLL